MRADGARQWLGMRWWLGIAFGLIAALTAVAVVRVLSERSEVAFRESAEEFAVGNAVAAAETLNRVATVEELRDRAQALAQMRRLSLFAFDGDGRLVVAASPSAVRFEQVPDGAVALQTALAGPRYIASSPDGTSIVVALHLRNENADVLVAYALRPELRDQLGIVRDEVGEAALWATLLGATVGLVVATLFARRIRRIARTARAIEDGDFSRPVADRFPDEIGSLATSIERMRTRLAALIAALQEDRDRFEQLVERLNEGVLLLDRELRITFANGHAADAIPAAMLSGGASLAEAWPDERVLALARRLFTDAAPPEPAHVDVRGRLLRVSGVPAAGGETALLIVADTTERERAERAQREFVTNAAHELRTPIAGIVTSVEMLQTGAKDDPAARDQFLAHIEREAARLTRLTRALLVLARAEARQEEPRAAPVEVEPLLRRIAESFEPLPGVALEVECEPGLEVHTDADLLEQALGAVVQNARKYTDAGAIVLRGTRSGGVAAVEVEDTGRGVPEAEQARIFERFYRGIDDDGGGFGLGLAIAAQAVRVLGGRIDVKSTSGAGTTVRVVLPAARAEVA
ncbi:MAG TPA: ATP-binding protein [Gaiellaceae bacterium]|nr:ATP-binding protein [Gaiellaceae bacterium]